MKLHLEHISSLKQVIITIGLVFLEDYIAIGLDK